MDGHQLLRCLNQEARNQHTKHYFKRKIHTKNDQSEIQEIALHIIDQKWTGLVVTENPIKGKCVKSTKVFKKGCAVCDYHGVLYPANTGERIHRESEFFFYSYFFQCIGKRYMLDANQFPCPCHRNETFGRRINHSVRGNVKGSPHTFTDRQGNKNITILFRAIINILPDEEILYDYGVRRLDSGCKEEWLLS
jgi:hypothetical protein